MLWSSQVAWHGWPWVARLTLGRDVFCVVCCFGVATCTHSHSPTHTRHAHANYRSRRSRIMARVLVGACLVALAMAIPDPYVAVGGARPEQVRNKLNLVHKLAVSTMCTCAHVCGVALSMQSHALRTMQ